uniref:Uncharacterized protein n=1 Tax=Anguilla anguilla TaxID=7936 RepID=A0A0E9W9S8_ANGAN
MKAFEQATGLKVEDSGLWLTRSGILGASPDGLVRKENSSKSSALTGNAT